MARERVKRSKIKRKGGAINGKTLVGWKEGAAYGWCMAMWGGVCWVLGIIFAILGIAADAANGTLGLESASWFLLAIAMFVASIPCYLGWAVGVYVDIKEAKK